MKEEKDLSNSKYTGIVTLILIMLAFQVGTFIYHKIKSAPADKATSLIAEKSVNKKLFTFDPNTIGCDSLILLGFSERQAGVIIKYRNKGGKFRQKKDFSRMYVVSPQKYEELSPYIKLAPYIKIKKKAPEDRTSEWTAGQKTPRQNSPAHKYEGQKESEVSSRAPAKTKGNNSSTGSKDRNKKWKGDKERWIRYRDSIYKAKYDFVIDLNEADSATLTRLRGIGPYYARKIIAYRKKLRSFYSPLQLLEISGITQECFDNFKKNVKVDTAGIIKFKIDTANFKFLSRHPYIGPYAARGIIMFKKYSDSTDITIKKLVRASVLSPEQGKNLSGYIDDL
ncbi:MAG: helix-hairpin-helix domain-containing protein [Bacteroidales bacterium]|jgi:DNA uptake protein ComE-like DNA-binding protein|nr:helix-hairpin-helix domain-containing protein [Bacteroidales bacterium]